MNRKSTVILILSIFLAIIITGAGFALLGRTFIALRVPALTALAISMAVTGLSWNFYKGSLSRYLVCGVIFMLAASFSFTSFLALNYCFRREQTDHKVEVTVTKKFSREKTRYRRLARGRMVADGTYHTYHIVAETPDGNSKEVTISIEKYNRMKRGMHADISIADGLFGYPVITDFGNIR